MDVVRVLAADPDREVRRRVAAKHKLPADLVVKFARDPDEIVRREILRRKDLPGEILEVLRGDCGLPKTNN